jgi:hypothetical protein
MIPHFLWVKLPNELTINCEPYPTILIELSLKRVLLLFPSLQTLGKIYSHHTSKLGLIGFAGREKI